MDTTGVERVNRVLDRIPRDTFHLGARTVPAYRSMGILGFHLAVPIAVLTAFRTGVPVLEAFDISAIAGLSFFGYALLRRALTGRENIVLLEHVWVALGAVTLYLWVADAPIVPGLDVLSVALCVFLAGGRVGCFIAGCCHGHPASIGPVYRVAAGLPQRLRGVRLFPVQLVEATGLLGIGAAGLVLAGGRPGSATVWVLATYATIRFGLEAWRGDLLPSVAGVLVSRIMAVVQLAAALLASEVWLVPDGNDQRYVVTGVLLTVVLVAGILLQFRRRDPLAVWAHLDEVWLMISRLARSATGERLVTGTTSQNLHLAASWSDAGLHVSLSHPSRPVEELPHAFGLVPLARTATATHVLVPTARLGLTPEQYSSETLGATAENDRISAVQIGPRPDRLTVGGAPSSHTDGYFGATPDL